LEEVAKWAEENALSSDWDLIGLEQLDLPEMVNFKKIEDNCPCPYCQVEECGPEDVIIRLKCPQCDELLILADGGWTSIPCKNCEKLLERQYFVEPKNEKEMLWSYDEDSKHEGE
jgi:phage FluMu protein Com